MRLVLAGDVDFRPPIERRIAELRLSRPVTLTGWIGSNELRKLITEATLVGQPSLMEGLPIVRLEAMAQGGPVISTYTAGASPNWIRTAAQAGLCPLAMRPA